MKATFEHLGFSGVWLRRLTKAINNELRKGWVALFDIEFVWQMRQTFENNVVFGCGLADTGAVILSKFNLTKQPIGLPMKDASFKVTFGVVCACLFRRFNLIYLQN